MPAFTVTAVDTGTDELTAVGHGLLTGDRLRLRNVGGALPAATPSLAATTDYFAIRTNADEIKVATSSANALAGTAINLTGSGSGTTTIEYGLPFCSPTAIAAPGGQIKSADLNGTWNSLVALYSMVIGQPQGIWPTFMAGTYWLGQGFPMDANTTFNGSPESPPMGFSSKTSGGTGNVLFRIDLPTGTRIQSITVFGRDGNSAGVEVMSAKVVTIDTTGSGAQIGSTKTSTGSNNGITSIGWTVADTGFTPTGYVMADAQHYVKVALSNTSVAAEVQVYDVKVVTG